MTTELPPIDGEVASFLKELEELQAILETMQLPTKETDDGERV